MIRYQGGEYDFALTNTTKPELREIKKKCGMTVRQLMEGIEQLDVDAMTALRWLVLRSDGQHDDLVLNPDEEYDYWEWLNAFSEGEEDKPEDPTGAGSLPATSTLTSSESSDQTSTSSAPSTPSPSPGTAAYANGSTTGSLSEESSPMYSESTP